MTKDTVKGQWPQSLPFFLVPLGQWFPSWLVLRLPGELCIQTPKGSYRASNARGPGGAGSLLKTPWGKPSYRWVSEAWEPQSP